MMHDSRSDLRAPDPSSMYDIKRMISSKETIEDNCSEKGKGAGQKSTPVQKLGKKSDGRVFNALGIVLVCFEPSMRLKWA